MCVGVLLVREVISFAEQEHDDIGVGFDIAGLAKVGQLGALVGAGFNPTVELRQEDHADIHVLGESLQAGGDFADLIDALPAVAFGGADEFEIVNHDGAEPRPRLRM